MQKLLLLPVLFIIAACSSAAPQREEKYNFVPVESVAHASLQSPPAVDSPEWKREVQEVLNAQRKASKKQITDGRREHKMRLELVAETLNPRFDRVRYPLTYQLLQQVGNDCRAVVHAAKTHWDTTRPYLVDKSIKALVEGANTNGAYPSGHATCSHVWAEVLAQLVPEKKADLKARAEAIAYHRVVLGLHFPHDVKGGEQLAAMFWEQLQSTRTFQTQTALAQREWDQPK